MHADFWHQRWADGRIGFHLGEVNPMLVKHYDKLVPGENSSVFVPLCGKSNDLGWLASRTGSVTGIEINAEAVKAFFHENEMEPSCDSSGLLEWWSAKNIQLACGDFFQLTQQDLAGVSLVYDRAALIALPVEMRRNYVAHLSDILEPATRMLLVTLEYDQSKIDGPPFSVAEDEVQSLFAESFDIERVDSRDALEDRFRDRGLSAMREKAYILQRRDTA